jgi:hypothetical protein
MLDQQSMQGFFRAVDACAPHLQVAASIFGWGGAYEGGDAERQEPLLRREAETV